jgi:hypothetical protein
MIHYHIQWSDRDTLDWESFASRAEAEASAKQLSLPGESYTTEERDESCPRCQDSMKMKHARVA